MKTFEEIIAQLKGSDRKVEIGDVAECVLVTMALLDEKSPSFARVKDADPKGYNGLVNTLLFTLVSNLSIIGLDANAALDFVKDLEDENVKALGIAIVSKEGRK